MPWRKEVVWPMAGLALGFGVGIIPTETGIPLGMGMAAWGLGILLIAACSGNPAGARFGVLVAGLILAIPCFVVTVPLVRVLVAGFAAVSFYRAAGLIPEPSGNFGARLGRLCGIVDIRQVQPADRHFDLAALRTLAVSTCILAGAIFAVKSIPASGAWLLLHWLAGGTMVMAVAEMCTACLPLWTSPQGLRVPPFFRSPYRSTSLADFWARRWNLPTSELLRRNCFDPLARSSVTLALWAAFAVSGAGHALLAYLALREWPIAGVCGAFFLAQPLLITVERRMGVRRWRTWAQRTWTLGALAVTSPLFLVPGHRVIEPSWDPAEHFLVPTLVALGFVVALNGIITLSALAYRRAGDA